MSIFEFDEEKEWKKIRESEYQYGVEDGIEKGLDEFMGLIGRDTQKWFHCDIVIHWGIHTWTFYNHRNISDFTKEEIEYFDKNDYDYE